MSMICIDPSIDSMGVAMWYNFRKWPDSTILITSKGKNKHWKSRALNQVKQLSNFLEKSVWVDLVIIELPTFFQSNKGMVAVRGGALVKLSFLVGALAQCLKQEKKARKIKLVTPGEWKGQLPKRVVIQRIKKILGKQCCVGYKEDIWDAVGIGLSQRGLL